MPLTDQISFSNCLHFFIFFLETLSNLVIVILCFPLDDLTLASLSNSLPARPKKNEDKHFNILKTKRGFKVR